MSRTETNKRYYEKHKEEMKQRAKEWREKNKDKAKEYSKKYREKHKEEIKQRTKEWRQNHKENWNEKMREYRKTHNTTTLVLNSKKRRVEKMRAEGITNPWYVINRGAEPKYKEDDEDGRKNI